MVSALYWLCIVSIQFQDGVNDLNVSANESIFFFTAEARGELFSNASALN